jgi:hypothetical protein
MDVVEIDRTIKDAQAVKRAGDVTRARNLLEGCLTRCKTDGTLSDYIGLAPLHKSIAKLCYVQNDFDKAKKHYRSAIEIYRSSGVENEIMMNLVHLGCCSPEFRKSNVYPAYVRSLMGQGQSPLSDDMSIVLINIGISYLAEM